MVESALLDWAEQSLSDAENTDTDVAAPASSDYPSVSIATTGSATCIDQIPGGYLLHIAVSLYIASITVIWYFQNYSYGDTFRRITCI